MVRVGWQVISQESQMTRYKGTQKMIILAPYVTIVYQPEFNRFRITFMNVALSMMKNGFKFDVADKVLDLTLVLRF